MQESYNKTTNSIQFSLCVLTHVIAFDIPHDEKWIHFTTKMISEQSSFYFGFLLKNKKSKVKRGKSIAGLITSQNQQ